METNTSCKIFIVDDDPFSRMMYQQHICNLGYHFVAAFENGMACLERMAKEQPEIIFLDHNMDTLNGVQVLQEIKLLNPNIFVVFISGQDDVQTAVNSLKYGAFDYIVKGDNDTVRIEQVLDKIAAVVELQLMNSKSTIF